MAAERVPDERALELAHKAVYAFMTGAVADALVGGPAGVPAPRVAWDDR